jgi:UDP-2-acetamido-3-amino-2,3-dideoxy-glucuronate N-acetyltransferase
MSEYGHRLEFNDLGQAECPESRERYELHDKFVVKVV